MEDFAILVHVKCGACGHSLMNPNLELDGQPSIDLEAKVKDRLGHVFLSQVYGSYAKSFAGVDDVPGSVASFACPHCHEALPVTHLCECGAPQAALRLEIGGSIRFCTRNGCKAHSLVFEDVEELFWLFESQHEPREVGGVPAVALRRPAARR